MYTILYAVKNSGQWPIFSMMRPAVSMSVDRACISLRLCVAQHSFSIMFACFALFTVMPMKEVRAELETKAAEGFVARRQDKHELT